MNTLDFLTGKTTDHLTGFLNTSFLVHKEMHDNLKALVDDAKKEGFELALSSSFRSYEAQKTIWDEKVTGIRKVLDSNSIPVDISTKTKEELLFLILRWSAIPGGSRHHWGTDIDVFDQLAKPSDYKLQLIPSEYEKGGLFYELNLWLSSNMQRYGFFRPYSEDCGGIAPEPWHLSFSPLSERFIKAFSYDLFALHLEQSNFHLIEEARDNSLEIYQRFILLS